ncbi:GNAT family N-acetyltransferase [Fusibacter sp. JL298sf-3]
MTIRKLVSDDFHHLEELMQAYKWSIGEPAFSKEQFLDLQDAILNKKIDFYVVSHEGQLIAMCSIASFFSTFNFTKSALFEDFFVSKKYRGKGVARKLIEYVFECCKSAGIDTVLVGSSEIDVDMYKSLGFSNALGHLLAYTVNRGA